MKFRVPSNVEIDIAHVEIVIPFDDDDAVPVDLPARSDESNTLTFRVYIDSGNLMAWPDAYPSCCVYVKAVDAGCYRLFTEDGDLLAARECEPVPHGVVPGDYGDYVELHIAQGGRITNWPKAPDVSEFFKS